MPRAEHQVLIDAPIEKVFAIITDYERYPEFLPDMKEVVVVSRHEGVAVVRFELELIMRVSYTLRLVEEPPARLSWTLEEAKMVAENNGGWTLVKEGERTRATYALEVKLRGLIPKSVSTRLLGTTLPQTLERFKARSEGRA
jgi:ribosome-associated toxin RatA of RatAB toxin-antitoxin module